MNYEFDYTDLALRFIQDQVSQEEKCRAQRLILTSPDFRETLNEQLTLQAKLQLLKQPIPNPVKQRVYLNVTNQEKEVEVKVLEVICQYTLPTIVWQILKLFQRRVLVHE